MSEPEQNKPLNWLGVKNMPCWLLWAEEDGENGKKIKTPYYTSGRRRSGLLGSSRDRGLLVSRQEALARKNGHAGLGIALLGDGLACIDLDKCRGGYEASEEQAEILARARRAGARVEISPSGNGYHIWGTVPSSAGLANWATRDGIEFYCTTGS